MYGIIDIGSNTMRLSCYRVVDRELIPAFHKKAMAGLAGYVDDKQRLSEKGIRKAIGILEDFKNIVMCVGLDSLYVVATASFRNVENTKEVVEKIQKKTGFLVEVLSGREEAMYDFKGASYYVEAERGLVVDIGGGSTELVSFEGGKAKGAASVPIGSLNLFARHVEGLFPSEKERRAISELAREQLEKLELEKEELILGVGGTNRGCLKLYNDFYSLSHSNVEMDCGKIREMMEKFLDGKKNGMGRILKIAPDRIHTILPGMLVLDEVSRFCKCQAVQVSSWGVREGYLIEKVL